MTRSERCGWRRVRRAVRRSNCQKSRTPAWSTSRICSTLRRRQRRSRMSGRGSGRSRLRRKRTRCCRVRSRHHERGGLPRCQCGRDHALVAACGEQPQSFVDVVGVERMVRVRGQRRDVVAARATARSGPACLHGVVVLPSRTRGYGRYCAPVALLLITHERFLDHEAGRAHPERPDRLRAAWRGIEAADLGSDLLRQEARPADAAALLRVHDPRFITQLEGIDAAGGGRLDPDTRMNEYSALIPLLKAVVSTQSTVPKTERTRVGMSGGGCGVVRVCCVHCREAPVSPPTFTSPGDSVAPPTPADMVWHRFAPARLPVGGCEHRGD